MSQDELRRRLDEVEARCAAQAKTIEVLIDTAEARQAARDGDAYKVFRRSQAVEALVEEKTRALEEALLRSGEAQAQLADAQSKRAARELATDLLQQLEAPLEALGRLVERTRSTGESVASSELEDTHATLQAVVQALRAVVGCSTP